MLWQECIKSEFSLCHMNTVKAKESYFIAIYFLFNDSISMIFLCNLIIPRTNLSGIVAAEDVLNNITYLKHAGIYN